MDIFVGNLPETTAAADLRQLLGAYVLTPSPDGTLHWRDPQAR